MKFFIRNEDGIHIYIKYCTKMLDNNPNIIPDFQNLNFQSIPNEINNPNFAAYQNGNVLMNCKNNQNR